MTIFYDDVISAFLNKVTEYDFLRMTPEDRGQIVDGYLHRARAMLAEVLSESTLVDSREERLFTMASMTDSEADEIIEILSEGMLVQWMKPYVYKQENLENLLNGTDWSSYSPAELLKRVSETYEKVQKNYVNLVRNYSYRHGDLTSLHM